MNMNSIGYSINHEVKTITITKDFEKQSTIRNTTEYKELWKLREHYPQYDIQRRRARANAGKNAFKGINLEKMVSIIEKYDDKETRMRQFREVLAESKKTGGFGRVRGWFIQTYKTDLQPKTPEAKKRLSIEDLLA